MPHAPVAGSSRFRRWGLTAGLAVLVLLAACSTVGGPILEGFTAEDRKEQGFTKHFRESLFQPTRDGRYSVEVLVEGHRFRPGMNSINVIVHDDKDADVADASVFAAYRREGGRNEGTLKADDRGRGLYLLENLPVSGPGRGVLEVAVERNGVRDSAEFHVQAEE